MLDVDALLVPLLDLGLSPQDAAHVIAFLLTAGTGTIALGIVEGRVRWAECVDSPSADRVSS